MARSFRRRKRCGASALLAAACLLLINGAAALGQIRQLPLIATARQAHSLAPSETAKAYPAHLRGVVIYYDPYQEGSRSAAGQRALFMADKTGSLFLRTGNVPLPPIHTGSIIDVRGVTDPGGFAPIITDCTVRLLPGTRPVPKPRIESLPRLVTGAEDGQWVAIEGIVHAVDLEGKHAIFTIATSDGVFSATTIREDGADYRDLVDAKILVQGVACPLYDNKRRMLGVRLLFPGLKWLKVEERGSANPFALPIEPLGRMFQFSPGGTSLHRIHARGTVTLSWPGQTVCITDASEGLCLQTSDRIALHVGQLVDVAGFPALEDYQPTLIDATLRPMGNGDVLIPTPSRAESAFTGDYDGELVRMRGKLIGRNWSQGSSTLLIDSGTTVFPAVLPPGSIRSEEELASEWTDGSTVAVTGVLAGKVNQHDLQRREGISTLESFQILLQSPQNVAIVAAPSWWNGQHALTVLGSVVVITLGILVWAQVLRHQVHRQTAVIRSNEQKFRHMARHDALTGLYIRTVLLERLDAEIEKASLNTPSLALFMIDVDGFKQINDTIGHAAGDEVLTALSRRLQGSVRETDTVARMGGDEFAALFLEVREVEEIEAIAAQLLTAISAPFAILGNELSVSVSIGITAFPEGGKDSTSLLRSADVALYRAKARGRNRYHVYRSDPSQALPIKSVTLMA
jgi:diguanylate cyclase (GGDEF)-like protein